MKNEIIGKYVQDEFPYTKLKNMKKNMLLRGIYIYGIKILKKGNVNAKFKK